MRLKSHHLVVGVSARGLATNEVAGMGPMNALISAFLRTVTHCFLIEGIRILTARGKSLAEGELLGTFAWARKVRMHPRLWPRRTARRRPSTSLA